MKCCIHYQWLYFHLIMKLYPSSTVVLVFDQVIFLLHFSLLSLILAGCNPWERSVLCWGFIVTYLVWSIAFLFTMGALLARLSALSLYLIPSKSQTWRITSTAWANQDFLLFSLVLLVFRNSSCNGCSLFMLIRRQALAWHIRHLNFIVGISNR